MGHINKVNSHYKGIYIHWGYLRKLSGTYSYINTYTNIMVRHLVQAFHIVLKEIGYVIVFYTMFGLCIRELDSVSVTMGIGSVKGLSGIDCVSIIGDIYISAMAYVQ